MNHRELINDLNSKTGNVYFKCKLFKNDLRVFPRRSFNDLFKYYKRFKVTEKMLAKALKKQVLQD